MIGEPEEIFADAARQHSLVIAQQVVDEIRASPLTPRGKSGTLAAGYRATEYEDGAAITNPAAPYWSFVEYGHNVVNQTGEVVGHAGQRAHVRPAIDAVRKLRES